MFQKPPDFVCQYIIIDIDDYCLHFFSFQFRCDPIEVKEQIQYLAVTRPLQWMTPFFHITFLKEIIGIYFSLNLPPQK